MMSVINRPEFLCNTLWDILSQHEICSKPTSPRVATLRRLKRVQVKIFTRIPFWPKKLHFPIKERKLTTLYPSVNCPYDEVANYGRLKRMKTNTRKEWFSWYLIRKGPQFWLIDLLLLSQLSVYCWVVFEKSNSRYFVYVIFLFFVLF